MYQSSSLAEGVHHSFGASSTALGTEASKFLHGSFLSAGRHHQYSTDAKSLDEIVNGFDTPAESARKFEAYCRQQTSLGRAGTTKLNSEILTHLPQILLCLSRWLRAESSTVDAIILSVFDPSGLFFELIRSQSGAPGPAGRVNTGGNLSYLLPISVLPSVTQRELLIQTGEQFESSHHHNSSSNHRSLYATSGGRKFKARDTLCSYLSLPDRYISESRSIQLTAEEYFLFCFVYLITSGPISAIDIAAGRSGTRGSQHSHSGRKELWSSSRELGIGSSRRRCPSDTGEVFSDSYDKLLDLYLAKYFGQESGPSMGDHKNVMASSEEREHNTKMGLLLVHLVTAFWISPQLWGPVGVAQMRMDVPLLRSLRTVCIRVLALDTLKSSIAMVDAAEVRRSRTLGGINEQEWTLITGDCVGGPSPLPPAFPPECQVLLPSLVELLHVKLSKGSSPVTSSTISSETAVYLIKIWIMLLQPWSAGTWIGTCTGDGDVWPYYVAAMQCLLRNPVTLEATPLYYPLMLIVFEHPAVSGTCEDMLVEGEDDRKFFNSPEIYSFIHMLVVLFECIVNDQLMAEVAVNSLPQQGGGNAVFATPTALAGSFVDKVYPVYRALLRSVNFIPDFKQDVKRIVNTMKVSSFWGRTILVTGDQRRSRALSAGMAQSANSVPSATESKLERLKGMVNHALFAEDDATGKLPSLLAIAPHTATPPPPPPPRRISFEDSPPREVREEASECQPSPAHKVAEPSYDRPLKYRGSRWSRPIAKIEFAFLMQPCRTLALRLGQLLNLDPIVAANGQTEPYVEWTRSLCSARVLFWLMISIWFVLSNVASDSIVAWIGPGIIWIRCLWIIMLLLVAQRYWTAP